jgi:hypothetical protein
VLRPSSRATDCSLPSTLANSVVSAANLTQRRQARGGRSHSLSSVSTGTKRLLEDLKGRFEEGVQARVKALCKEYAKKLKD